MNKFSVKDLARVSIVTALYVALTLALAPISFGNIQIRIAEMLILLCCFDHKYAYGLSLGCLITNIFSPLGWYDIVFGTLATVISVIMVCVFKKHMLLATIFPVIFNGIIVGLELHFVFELPLLITMLEVAAGELIAVSILGYATFKPLSKNKKFMELVTSNRLQMESASLISEDNDIVNKED